MASFYLYTQRHRMKSPGKEEKVEDQMLTLTQSKNYGNCHFTEYFCKLFFPGHPQAYITLL